MNLLYIVSGLKKMLCKIKFHTLSFSPFAIGIFWAIGMLLIFMYQLFANGNTYIALNFDFLNFRLS